MRKCKSRLNNIVSQKHIQQAAAHMKQGGIVAYPTEGVFGLGCDPCNAKTVKRLLRLKQRPASKGLILIASDIEQLKPFISDIPKKALKTWPGPVTWLLPTKANTPYWLTGKYDTIAVRITAHPAAAALCKAFGGAIVSTSANRSNQNPALTDREVRKRFDTSEIFVVPGKVQTPGTVSRIIDARSDKALR
ncbi:MAG: Sua5/YciO/YrdC/YwlC family protein [Proteobacteria bacterium]|nr:Sua5/YciO/YrdC/YwlC family protein [Pseudomonadota bacterium]